jgi:nucleoside-diphosphate kinase
VTERTLVLIKPDAVRRGLVGEILGRFERKGFRIVAMEQRSLDEGTARRHYAEHEGKAFFDELVEFITGGPLVACVLEGRNAVGVVRTMMGATDPAESLPGSIRGDLGMLVTENLIHGSDSDESAAREIALFFPQLSD